jgi:mycothiol synthase
VDHEFPTSELTDADVPAAVELCRAALDLSDDATEAPHIVRRLRETAALPGSPAPRRTVGFQAVDGGSVVGVALGSISQRDAAVGHVDLIAVAPNRRRRGIGRSLLARVEAALAGLGARELLLAGNPPNYAWPGIDVRYTPAVCMALALGYEQDRTAWNMTADLSYDASPALGPTEAAERRLAERGVAVRRATADDAAALVDFARANFGAAWAAEVADSVARAGAGCHLAVREGQLLGFAAYGSSRPSWFGPMGTVEAAQGLGIGGVLLRRCLRDQRAAGHERAQIGWVGPVPFYAGSAGARIERVFFLFRKHLSAIPEA